MATPWQEKSLAPREGDQMDERGEEVPSEELRGIFGEAPVLRQHWNLSNIYSPTASKLGSSDSHCSPACKCSSPGALSATCEALAASTLARDTWAATCGSL